MSEPDERKGAHRMNLTTVAAIGVLFVAYALISWALGMAGTYEMACFFGGVFAIGLAAGIRLGLGKQ